MRVGCCIHSPTQRVRQKSTIHILDGHPRHIPGNFFKWFLKQIANHKALADVKVSERVKMDTSWLAQILMRTRVKFLPRMTCST